MLSSPMVPGSSLNLHHFMQTTLYDTRIVFLRTWSQPSITTVDSSEKLPSRDKNVRYKGIPTLTRKFPNECVHQLFSVYMGVYETFGLCPRMDGDISWQPCVHPEGALYFYNNSRVSIYSRKVIYICPELPSIEIVH